MKRSNLVKFLLGNQNNEITNIDPYWNDVQLLLLLDGTTNTRGLPFYKDYSKYQYWTRYIKGTENVGNNYIRTISNDNPNLPTINNIGSVNVTSYTYLPNTVARNERIAEINGDLFGTVTAGYIETFLQGNPSFALNQDDFTIELSFYADQINLPWRIQSLLSVGNCVRQNASRLTSSNVQTYLSLLTNNSFGNGYGVFIEEDDLLFYANNKKYPILNSPIEIDTWYHIAIQRRGNTLTTYVNANLTNTYTFNTNLDLNIFANSTENTDFRKLLIGRSLPYDFFNISYGVFNRGVETCFSGGLSNIRLTRAARYNSQFYTLTLPFPLNPVQNKLDAEYNNTLFNIPATYDYYDYSPNSAHILNRDLLKTIPNLDTPSILLDGDNFYRTDNINSNLDANEWTVEFYIVPYVANEAIDLVDSTINSTPPVRYNAVVEGTLYDFLYNQFDLTRNYPGDIEEVISLLKLTTSSGKKVMDIDFNVRRKYLSPVEPSVESCYFSCNISSNGDDWIIFPSEVNQTLMDNPQTFLPDEQIKFAGQFVGPTTNTVERTTEKLKDSTGDARLHITVQRVNTLLFFFVNGVLNKTIALTNTIYSEGNVTLQIGGFYLPLIGSRSVLPDPVGDSFFVNYPITFGISGIRVTNAARYSTVTNNDIEYDHSQQPLPLSLTALAPSRARVIDIIRKADSKQVSTQQVTWLVLFNQAVDNVTTDDFTLTQLNGLTLASILSITKIDEFVYELTADVGTGTGSIIANFNDRSTILYKDTSTNISYFLGELSIEGEEYLINKTRPTPIITSGSNPYINANFLINIAFDAPIETFNPENIGLVNCQINKVQLIDAINFVYELEIEPLNEGVISIQALEGTGITDTALLSLDSNKLTRVFKDFFPIVQLPLNTSVRFNDLSPSSLDLSEIIINNTLFSTSEFPLGESSSLSVGGINEQSGFTLPNYNATSGTLNPDVTIDWTIEFFLRINSTVNGTTKQAHVLSIQNGNSLCIAAKDGELIITRSPGQAGDLFNSVEWKDRATTNFVEWSDNSATIQEKFPHFAISKKGEIYRFYVNGERVGIIESPIIFDITRGILNVGYFPQNVDDIPYLLSNLRITYGKALYTAYRINVPFPPYPLVPNISDFTEILNYISIYSNNNNSNVANEGDLILLKFNSIVPLPVSPIVTINNQQVTLTREDTTINSYSSTYLVGSGDLDGTVPFSITIPSQLGISERVFTNTTNNSFVVIDNTPLDIQITSNSPNNSDHVFDIDILFSEDINRFELSDLVLTNCTVSNLYKYPNDTRYRVSIKATTSGNISILILENTIQDLSGNFNIQSNTFTRDVIVPVYLPDPYWNNVTLLLQPESSTIVDLSQTSATIVNNNVNVSSNTSPSGLSNSMLFNGQGSLNITGDTLPSTIEYTIELFTYISTKTALRLGNPTLNAANNIQTNSFELSWDSILDSSAYVLDIGLNAQFTQLVPGFDSLNTGLANSITIESLTSPNSPKLNEVSYVSDYGFILDWEYDEDSNIAYQLDIAKDSNFLERLNAYTNKISKNSFELIGDTSKVIETVTNQLEINPVEINNSNPSTKGSVITGLLADGSNFPQLNYFLEESSIRVYQNDGYNTPAIAEDIEILKWVHVALVNRHRYTYLYIDGNLVDKVRNLDFSNQITMGYNIGYFNGYITGVRITKGVARYTEKTFDVPALPYPTS